MATNNAVNTSLSGQTGTANFVGSNTPTLITPLLGTPTSGNLSNCTAYPFSSLSGSLSAAQLIPLGNSGVSAIDNTSYDLSSASGDLTISGLAFMPSLVIFIAGMDGSKVASWGYDNGTSKFTIGYQGTSAVFGIDGGNSLRMITSIGNSQSGHITSFTSDGFVMSFTKAGSPTGTATISYLAFK